MTRIGRPKHGVGNLTKVFDCFTFNDELDLLEFRLRYLQDVVDQFVVVEAPRTYSGIEKPLNFAMCRERYAPWADRIIHVVVDDLPLPANGDRWIPENFQHTAILRGLSSAKAGDVILITDVDEIPDADVVRRLRKGLDRRTALEMVTSYFRANYVDASRWRHPKAAPLEELGDPCALRLDLEPSGTIKDAGIHLSFLMMGAQLIARKYRAFAHDEFDNPRDRAATQLERCIRHAVDQFGRGTIYEQLQVDELSPLLRAAYDYRPDWFNFAQLPPRWRRIAVSRYARWRRTRVARPRIVGYLDDRFDTLAPVLAPMLAAYAFALRARNWGGRRSAPYSG